MGRSLIREGQVLDADFISNAEHSDPNEIPHTFIMSVDTPTSYSGSAGKLLAVDNVASGIEFVDPIPNTFIGLSDTPDYNPGKTYYYATSSASGIVWKSDYLENEIHISPQYTGDSNGSITTDVVTVMTIGVCYLHYQQHGQQLGQQ